MQPDSPQPNGHASRFQKILLGVLLVLVLGSTLVPLVYGNSLAADQTFTGASRDTIDHGLYLSIMQQGAGGAWKTLNLMTVDKQNLNLIHLFYVATGHAGGLFHLSMPVMYHVARLGVAGLFIFVVWRFLRRNLPEPAASLCTLIAFTAGGFGWTSYGHDQYSVDLWFSEANTFLTLYYWPHLAWALLLKTVAMLCLFKAREHPNPRYGAIAGAVCAALAFDHPMDLIGLAIVFLAYSLARIVADQRLGQPIELGRSARFYGLTALIAAPFALFVYLQARADPLQVQTMAASGIDKVPSLLRTALGFGLLLPLSIVPAIEVLRRRWDESNRFYGPVAPKRLLLFLYIWGFTNMFVMYPLASFWFARRLMLGAHLPIAILAAIGFVHLLRSVSPTIGRYAVFAAGCALAALMAISHILVFQVDMEAYDRGGSRNCRFYLNKDEIAMYQTLGTKVPAGYYIQPIPTVLNLKSHDPMALIDGEPAPDLTMLVYGPWLTQHQEIVGHPWETPHFLDRMSELYKHANRGERLLIQPLPRY